MSDIAIKVENLGKRYFIGGRKDPYKRLTETISDTISAPFRRLFGKGDDNVEEIWALKDVSFDIKKGDVVGIIGRNGAGKSTLLKILARITEPTTGHAEISGRVGSLLEVGTGFHPELTGRENIFLSGSVLGMKKAEIKKSFDEIVDFSGIEKFIDTPVKRYSSGMYMRLAFAVAAHLRTEILLVDEVLAVGDYEFQQKCLGKMGEVAGEGRTVLFVSHNLTSLRQICKSGMHILAGRINLEGDMIEVISDYLPTISGNASLYSWYNTNNFYDNDIFVPAEFYLSDELGNRIDRPFRQDEKVRVNIKGLLYRTTYSLQVGYTLLSEKGELVYTTLSTDCQNMNFKKLPEGAFLFSSELPPCLLNEGRYYLSLATGLFKKICLINWRDHEIQISIEVHDIGSESPFWSHKRPGIIAPPIEWSVLKETSI